jgi:uncharacterized membrane protein
MPLTINAPDIERRLQQEATRQGVSPAELAMHLLEAQLPSAVSLPAETAPFHSTASLPEWKRVFLEWVQSHEAMNLPQLAPQSLERASFYEDERHLLESS